MKADNEQHDIATVSGEGFDAQDIQAIKDEATRLGISFDEACKQILLERARQIRRTPRMSVLGKLIRNCSVH
ncbi:hypothetical protein [Pseudorhodoferax sp. Leaf265]|uniref:hypothetical protein n=1 Tax=Pseudorhodoferax sp. Leaf265 TaxID=1736315 RepID=UPI0012E8DEED|nr:hypothetical protein [Pseudorhodoferax sp. Leaf265]